MLSVLRIRGQDYRDGEVVEVVVESGRIVGMGPPTGRAALGGPDVMLSPGLLDAQVNGFAGYDLNSPTVTPGDVSGAVRSLWKAGVTLCCPTVTTGPVERIVRSLTAIARAADGDPVVRHGVAAIHLEGPYISPEDGPRGAHPREHVRPPDWEEFQRFQEAAGGRIGVVTLAPELPGALEFVERAAQDGLVVALGHHGASGKQIEAAVAAGARLCTHLGNGAHAVLSRHPNYIWEQLADDALAASIVVDGHHLPPSVVKCFVRAKGVQRLLLVSDAVHLAGLPPGRYRCLGRDVELGESGRISLVGTPYLAGSSLSLCQALANVIAFAGVTLREAVEMATLNPARLLGLEGDRGGLAVGQTADLLLFRMSRAERRVEVVATVAAGEVVFRPE